MLRALSPYLTWSRGCVALTEGAAYRFPPAVVTGAPLDAAA